MHFSALLIALIACRTFTAAMPTGASSSEDSKTAVAQKRTQERDLATSKSLLEEKKAYQLEMVEVAAFKYEQLITRSISSYSKGFRGR